MISFPFRQTTWHWQGQCCYPLLRGINWCTEKRNENRDASWVMECSSSCDLPGYLSLVTTHLYGCTGWTGRTDDCSLSSPRRDKEFDKKVMGMICLRTRSWTSLFQTLDRQLPERTEKRSKSRPGPEVLGVRRYIPRYALIQLFHCTPPSKCNWF